MSWDAKFVGKSRKRLLSLSNMQKYNMETLNLMVNKRGITPPGACISLAGVVIYTRA